MDTVVKAPLDYSTLDGASAPVRIRLSSTVVRVEHDPSTRSEPAASPEHSALVRVAYLRDGKMQAVRAANVVLACYNAIIPSLMPELPDAQKTALAYSVKVPMMYTNVLVRNWRAFATLGVQSVSSPCMLHTGASLDAASTVGGYPAVTTPDDPIVIHMTSNPNKPGLPRREQHRAGAELLLKTTFEGFEREVRSHLARALAGGGFDPAADIVGLTVNRWPYGYSYTYDTLADPDVPPEERPHVIGRRRFGQVAIANSDAGAAAFTNQAIDEAHRAVSELLIKNGLA
jgi:spermidine dehydrogenase